MPIGIFVALFGYLLGSIPTGVILSRLFSKVDPREVGSKNIGARNIFRTAGKGVATALGFYLPISTIPVLIEFMIFVGIVWKWRYISLGSVTCAITIPILIAFFRDESQAYFIASVIIAAVILYRHQSNISRLLQGTESKWTPKAFLCSGWSDVGLKGL